MYFVVGRNSDALRLLTPSESFIDHYSMSAARLTGQSADKYGPNSPVFEILRREEGFRRLRLAYPAFSSRFSVIFCVITISRVT